MWPSGRPQRNDLYLNGRYFHSDEAKARDLEEKGSCAAEASDRPPRSRRCTRTDLALAGGRR